MCMTHLYVAMQKGLYVCLHACVYVVCLIRMYQHQYACMDAHKRVCVHAGTYTYILMNHLAYAIKRDPHTKTQVFIHTTKT
jgi:hypothetical protein